MNNAQKKTLQAALDYYDRGFCPLPISPGSKSIGGAWKQYQTERPSREQIEAWFSDGEDHNIRIICGKVSGNLIVLDFDDKSRFEDFLREFPNIEQMTPIVKTERGYHVYLRTKEFVKSVKLPKLDIQGEGRYIIAPPSLHPSGITYHFINPEIHEPRIINNLREVGIGLDEPEKEQRSEPDWAEKALREIIPYGERDNTIFKLAGHLRSKGIPEGEAIEILSLVVQNRCEQPENDPFTREDVIKKVRSSYKERGSERLNSLTAGESLEMELEEIPELVNNCARIGDLTLLIGFGGIGKSSIALYLALCLAAGVRFLDFEVPNPERVLYLDLEMGEYEFRTRLNTLVPQLPEIVRDNFHWVSIPNRDVKSFKINNPRDKERLWNELAVVKPKLLVVDNHVRFHSGDANKESDMIPMVVTPFGEAMVQFDLGVLYLMHTPWATKDRPRGTVCIFDAASTVIAVEKPSAYPRGRTLKWTKNRSVRRGLMPSEVNIYYDPQTFSIAPRVKTTWLPDKERFPMKRNHLAQIFEDELGMSRRTAYRRIDEMEGRGELIEDRGLIFLAGTNNGTE